MKDNVFDRMVAENDDRADLAQGHEATSLTQSGDNEDRAVGTPADVKRITQELLKHGCIEESTRADIFRRAIALERQVMAALEPLDLTLRLDTHRGIAFLAVAPNAAEDPGDEEGWAHPLVRRQRLTLEQSLLVAMLRQVFVMHEQEAGVGQSQAKATIDELLPSFLHYFQDSGSDAKNESRLLGILDQLKTYGIVSEVDQKQEIIIRPLIAHLANPESLTALLNVLKQQSLASAEAERNG